MRDTFIRILTQAARDDERICLVTGDLGFGVLKPFWEAVPNQFFNAGIAEQNMAAVAAGMALEGRIVCTYSIGGFPSLRCLEQIRNDCAYHKANVKIVCVGAGLAYGPLGMSHHATEDLAVLRALPWVTIFSPADRLETEAVTKAMLAMPGTCYLRLGRGGEAPVRERLETFTVGRALPVLGGVVADVAVFATGAIASEARKACEILIQQGINVCLHTFPTIRPLDRELILVCAATARLVVTCEEHGISGGFGGAVAEVMAESPGHASLLRLGLNGTYCSLVGSQNYLREQYGLSAESMAARILERLS